jgi:hypothetical protein
MKTTIENLLKIENSKISEFDNYTLISIFDDGLRKIYYRFFDHIEPDAFIDDEDTNILTDIHFFENIEDVINQVYYITGEKIKIF